VGGSPRRRRDELGHDLDPHRELAELTTDLDAAYRAVASRLQDNDAVRVETADGHDRLVLTPLDKLDPNSTIAGRRIRETVDRDADSRRRQ